jgi:hypothetical protein
MTAGRNVQARCGDVQTYGGAVLIAEKFMQIAGRTVSIREISVQSHGRAVLMAERFV